MKQNTQMVRRQRNWSSLLAGVITAALFACAPDSRAASGTWTNDASSIWSDGTNWLNGTVSDGIDSTADFSAVDITTNRTVTLDSSRTIGNLNFADTTGANLWQINAGGSSVLTLGTSSGTPTLTTSTNGANSAVAVISAPLAGTGGLVKAGDGILTLGSTNIYSGTATINGGTLQLTNTSVAFSNAPVLYFSFDNMVGNTIINQGTGGAAMNGVLVGTNAAIVSGGRYGNALSAGTSLNNAYAFVNNPVLLLNNNAAGAWTVAMWMKSTTQGGVLLYQGSGGWVANNTQFHLVGTNNNTAGPYFGGVRNSQAWESGQTNQVTDGNWHFAVMTTAPGNVKTIYVDGLVDSFPNVANQNGWGAAAAGNQIWIGGTPDTGDLNAPLNGLIDEVYIYNRALSQAEIQTLMNTSSGPAATVPLPINTAVSVAAPGKLDLNGSSAMLSNLTGVGTVDTTLTGAILALNAGSNLQFDGTITNSVGTLGLTKLGNGTLTLTGTNGYTGLTTVSAGALTVNSTGIINVAGVSGVGSLTVGNVSSNSAVLNVTGGTVNVGAAATAIAQAAGSQGFVNVTSGKFASTSGTTQRDIDVGIGAGSFGVFRLSGGAVTLNGFLVGGITGFNSVGIWNISGGSVNVINNFAGTLGATAGTFGMMNVTGTGNYTSTNNTSGNGAGLYVGENGTGYLNVSGSGTLNLGGVANGTRGLAIGVGNSAAVTGTVNLGAVGLGGGTITTIRVVKNGAAASGTLNFHGGTLKASATPNPTFMSGLTAAYVYGEGATIDDSGQTLTIPQALIAPTGFGVSSIPVTSGGSGYLDTPLVTITGGSGVGATAIAQVDYSTGGATSGQVTNILITNPGSGYNNGDSLTITLIGGGGAGATVGTPTFIANGSGGLTKLGSGSINLTGGFTYTNDTVIQGGGLGLTASLVTPATAGSLTVNGGSLSVDSSGAVTLPVRNLNLQTSAALNIAYGTVFANPSFPAITANGSLTAAPTNIINITGFGLRPGTFTVIKYGSGTLSGADFSNFGLTLPPGVNGILVNNTGNQSIQVTITSSPNQLTWSGVGGTNWDLSTLNWTNNANGLPAFYQQYTNGAVIAGDGVVFDDTLTNDLVNPQPTNVNITANFTPFPVTVNSTLPYSISGPGGITGIGNLVKNNTGSLTLLTSNNFSGGLAINGGSVVVTNDSALGIAAGTVTLNSGTLQLNGNTTNNSRVLAVPATSSIGVSNGVIARLGGLVNGAGGLTKIDAGTLTLAGSNGIAGNLTVSQGTLNTLGNNNLPSVVTVGNNGGVDAVLNVGGGTFNALNNGGQFVSGLIAGAANGSSGDIRLTAGTLTVFQQLGLGNGAGSYGAFNMSGGTMINGSYIVVGFNGDSAVFNQSGGATTINTNLMTIAAGGTAAIGVVNFSGGTFTSTNGVTGNAGGRGGIFVGENGVGTLNVSGTASLLALGQANLTLGRTGAGSSGTVNLLGGTVTTLQVSRGAGSATLNFNGGTLKASGANASFVNGLNNAVVYNGGAVIDDGGFAVTIPQPLVAPGGFGVASIAVTPSSSSGYIDTPIVTISGGSGSNATATATVSGGQVTVVTVTCPGSGYLNTDSLSVSFSGGGVSASPPAAPTITFVANGTGGLTKKGAGTLTLTGANTFTGPITNSAGTLSLNAASTYNGLAVNGGTVAATTAVKFTGPTTITNGAVLTITQIGNATNSMGDVTFNGGAAVPGATLGVGLTGLNPTVALVNCGTLTFNGTNTISLSGAVSVGAIPLIKYATLAGAGTYTNLALPQGVVGIISNSVTDSTIYAVISSTGPGLVWTGTNSGVGLANLWDISSTTNWLLGSTPTTYRQPIIPGDAVTFNDSGSGTVILNTNAGPSTATISNNAVTYTIGGRGSLTGAGGITKLGTGTAILNLTNDNYSGDTTISNGTLQVGSATALSATANLNLGATGTLELNGFSETINGLFGVGTVDNNNTTNVALTIGGGGVWNGAVHDQGLGGGVSLTKIGNNTLVIGGSNSLNSTTASQVNAGVTIITNGAVINCTSSEYWVGPVAGNMATNIVDGGNITVANNFLVIGRGSATANGTLIINSGTVQKAGANVVVIGSLGATGTLIVNGGQLLNNSELWLGENPTAVANLYLNGGLLQATDIRPNSTGAGFPSVTPVAYFNGGTLQASASSANFLQVVSQVMSNGLVLDDGGFAVSVTTTALQSGDSGNGGLIKKGAGTLYLDTGNSYTGPTVVTNGTLAGIGTIAGNVIVAPAGNIGAGDAAGVGSFTISGSLNIQGKATLRVDKSGGGTGNDQLTGYTSVHFGGVLVVSNITTDATPITTADTFQIFSTGGTGNFTSIAGSPGPGLAYAFNPATGVLSVVTAAPAITGLQFTAQPVISGTSLTISGTNTGSGAVYLLTSTNVAAPLNTWQPVWTNVFSDSSSFTTNVPNAVNPAFSKQFYILSNTNQ